MELKVGADGHPVVDQRSADGFVDLTFRITRLRDDGTHYHMHLAASHENREVGFDAILVKGIAGGFDANMKLIQDRVYWEG